MMAITSPTNLFHTYSTAQCITSKGVLAISSLILVFNSLIFEVSVHGLFFKYPHKKKSYTDKSGDQGS